MSTVKKRVKNSLRDDKKKYRGHPGWNSIMEDKIGTIIEITGESGFHSETVTSTCGWLWRKDWLESPSKVKINTRRGRDV